MIQPISINKIQYNKNIRFRGADNAPTVVEKPKTTLTISDEYLEHIKEQNDKKIFLLRYVGGGLCIAIAVGLAMLFPNMMDKYSKVFGKKTADKKNIAKQEFDKFVSLVADDKIPVLSDCKTLNTDMKNFLQNQVNHITATKEILSDVGVQSQPKRLIIIGPPATGKSFYAKILAKTINADYAELNYADVNSKWVGEGLEKIQSNMESIKKTISSNPQRRYVLTLNEIDAFIPPATKMMETDMSGHVLSKIEQRSALINYLDDFAETCPNLIIVGTSNASAKGCLDSAVLSRFKKIIKTELPNSDIIYETLKMNLSKTKGGERFIEENEKNLKMLSGELAQNKYSFRNIEDLIDISKDYYLEDKLHHKDNGFVFEYLTKAKKDIKITDGDLI